MCRRLSHPRLVIATLQWTQLARHHPSASFLTPASLQVIYIHRLLAAPCPLFIDCIHCFFTLLCLIGLFSVSSTGLRVAHASLESCHSQYRRISMKWFHRTKRRWNRVENYFERPRGMVLVARLIGRVRIRNGETVVSSARFSAVIVMALSGCWYYHAMLGGINSHMKVYDGVTLSLVDFGWWTRSVFSHKFLAPDRRSYRQC